MHYTGYLLFFCILSFAFIYLIIKIYIIFLHHCHFPECILLVVKGSFQSLNPVFHLLNSGKDYVYKPQMNAVHPFDENDYLQYPGFLFSGFWPPVLGISSWANTTRTKPTDLSDAPLDAWMVSNGWLWRIQLEEPGKASVYEFTTSFSATSALALHLRDEFMMSPIR